MCDFHKIKIFLRYFYLRQAAMVDLFHENISIDMSDRSLAIVGIFDNKALHSPHSYNLKQNDLSILFCRKWLFSMY